jgi:hypothetical protein
LNGSSRKPALAEAVGLVAFAGLLVAQNQGLTRTLVLQADVSAPGHEIVVARVEVAPGGRAGGTPSASIAERRDEQCEHSGSEQAHPQDNADDPIRPRADDPEQRAAFAAAIARPQQRARGFVAVARVRATHVKAAATGATSVHG